ncbi:hypothetical protein LKI_01850 [Leuconostoc kimchii IMSNU 11154]|uniref:Uncharacterized protein n=1 Tax=Leuconostoc kimchii (strain IMSNU 11154 / KCTC 2386 / IH25) TaxID=762051 RepID=D5T0W4_LEUKI|nr:hypothetical protein LKI_01850 [Leuconostoc kimchii IMSNU 11154]
MTESEVNKRSKPKIHAVELEVE